MPILNYTTSIAVDKTVAEIQAKLVKAKAGAVLAEYDGAGNITALSFKSQTAFGLMAFRLPADPRPMAQVFKNSVQAGTLPRRYLNDLDQARRVTWRIIKDWVEAQLALIETGMVTTEQVFLPYAQNQSGQTLYESLVEKKFGGLLLGEGKPKDTAK